jgi:hypothetical protein
MESGAVAAREPLFVSARVRAPEWVIGGGSVALGLELFLVPWYGSASGWSSLGPFAYLVALCVLGGLAVLWFQGSLRAPAIPVCATTLELLVSGLTLAALVVTLATGPPGSAAGGASRAGAYGGLALCAAVALGTYRSLRCDGIRDADGPGEIERLSLCEHLESK